MSYCDRRPGRSRGFTLIEIAVVLIIIAIFLSMGAVMFRGLMAAQKRATTVTRMATVDAALTQFVLLNKRLPCPADGTIATGIANAGVEVRASGACTNNQINGVVPWVTIGLSETDATDAWDRRMTYRAASGFVADSAMDMSWCDPAGTAALSAGVCSTACVGSSPTSCTPPTTYLLTKGIEIRTITGTKLMEAPAVALDGKSAAAYVLISHGESGGGAYLGGGVLSSSTTTDGTEEQKNYANLVLQAYYVDDSLTDIAGASHFDDMVSRPSVLSLAIKAGLGPRAH